MEKFSATAAPYFPPGIKPTVKTPLTIANFRSIQNLANAQMKVLESRNELGTVVTAIQID